MEQFIESPPSSERSRLFRRSGRFRPTRRSTLNEFSLDTCLKSSQVSPARFRAGFRVHEPQTGGAALQGPRWSAVRLRLGRGVGTGLERRPPPPTTGRAHHPPWRHPSPRTQHPPPHHSRMPPPSCPRGACTRRHATPRECALSPEASRRARLRPTDTLVCGTAICGVGVATLHVPAESGVFNGISLMVRTAPQPHQA